MRSWIVFSSELVIRFWLTNRQRFAQPTCEVRFRSRKSPTRRLSRPSLHLRPAPFRRSGNLRLTQPAVAGNLDTAREKLTGKQTDLAPLLDNRACGIVWLSRKFWLVNLKIEALQALAACNELRFAELHAHWIASSYITFTMCRNSDHASAAD
jgi:hypothetical protein